MDLDQYLKRIHFSGEVKADLATLNKVHHQHLLHIPYEDIDVQLRRPLDFDPDRIFNKIVNEHRGGWCYEMNGLLGWALSEIGFEVTRHSGAANRQNQGDTALGSHLMLQVHLDGVSYLADVGFGDGMRYAVPIAPDVHEHGGLTYRLEPMQDGYWRMHNHPHTTMPSFDFRLDQSQAEVEAELAQGCKGLQDDPQSPFRQNLIAFRFTEHTIESLIGKTAVTITPKGRAQRMLDSIDDVHQDLRQRFGLDQDLKPVWEHIEQSHQRYLDYLAKQGNA